MRLITEIQTQEWFSHLVEECQAIIDKAVYNSRQEIIQGYWELGERVTQDKNLIKFAKGNQGFLNDLARNIGINERTLYYAIKFYQKFPSLYDFLSGVEEGKNISWTKIVTKYLPTVTPEKKPAKLFECPKCHYRGEESEFNEKL